MQGSGASTAARGVGSGRARTSLSPCRLAVPTRKPWCASSPACATRHRLLECAAYDAMVKRAAEEKIETVNTVYPNVFDGTVANLCSVNQTFR